MTLSNSFLQAATDRGFVHQCTAPESLSALLGQGNPIPAYIGFDCTAPSLHAGSLVSIMLLRLFQRCGHKPIVLMGGGTTKVGDPSGKDEARKLLTSEEINTNKAGIRKVFERYLTFGTGPTDALMVDNADWLDSLAYISFLRDIGRHFSVNRMLSMDSVKLRLDRDQPLSFLEFNYMALQAYDFLELSKRHACRLQMGGSDQWGNIITGIDLTRRIQGVELFGLTTPLLTSASGAKMGKTASGAVWLNADMLSSYDFWQYWRNVEDADVGRFLRLFTDFPLEEIVKLEGLQGAEINDAKKVLATAVTALAHGQEAAEAAAETARRTFEEKTSGDALPTIEIGRQELTAGIPFFELLRRTGLALSNGEARRLIKGGGGRLNGIAIDQEDRIITVSDIIDTDTLKISAGKKRHALIRLV